VAYGFWPLLGRGIDGRGQTVMVLEPAQRPARPGPFAASTDIRRDLVLFDRLFHLPAARLRIANLARTAAPWQAGDEEVQDTEIIHALAPGATIGEILVPAQAGDSMPRATAALTAALRAASAQRAAVLSISAGLAERCFTRAQVARASAAIAAAAGRHLTVVAASGDHGAAGNPCPGQGDSPGPGRQVDLPASDPLVLAAGGTTLHASHATGTYASETAWTRRPDDASGGGFSHLFTRPAYQDQVPGIGPAARGVPDVAADADLTTGMATAVTHGSGAGLIPAAGTSAAAPLWGALIALADQDAGRHLGLVNPALYRIAHSAAYPRAFHDITTGTNTLTIPRQTITGYQASPGWDPVTGWGSPNAAVLVPLLATPPAPAQPPDPPQATGW
jgi:kumamolisin